MGKVFIIAEAGVNHNGKLDLAKGLVDAAKDAGADAIKFQTFKAEKVISRYALKAQYQKRTTSCKESQLDMVKKLELSFSQFRELYEYCKKKNMLFLSTPFDLESIDFLMQLGLSIFKIPSGEITNLPYLRKVGGLRKKIMLSTGMADLKEIKNALDILTKSGTSKKNITILHCTTEYPAPLEDVNLLAMLTIKDAFKVNVGYSDHTLGIEVPVAAAAIGAAVIEKHFTLDRNLPGPDHKASLEPDEFKQMVKEIRNIEKALGCAAKKASPLELKNQLIVRKSIVAATNIKKGEILSEKNITAKRPGTGLSPMLWDKIIGKKSRKDFLEDELIAL